MLNKIAMYKLLIFNLLFAISCSAQTLAPVTSNTPPAAVSPEFVTWDKKMQDLGKVKKGEKRTLFFEFTNVGNEDAQIEIVDACACTTVDFPRGPIAPGAKGRIDAIFDSTEKEAAETIGITVVFKNVKPDGNPRIEVVEYKFDLEL